MNRFFNIILFLCVITSPCLAERITVENRYYGEIGDRNAFLSGTFARSENLRFFRDPKTLENMTSTLKENGFRSFRFHGPVESFWNTPLEKWRDQLPAHYSRKPYTDLISDREFIRYLHDSGMKAAFQMNIYRYFEPETGKMLRLDEHPEYIEAAAKYHCGLVQWVIDNGFRDSILYWELGNESYNLGFTPKEIAAIDSTYIKEIRRIDSDVKIAVDGQSPEHPRKIRCKDWSGTVGEWHKAFLNELVRRGHSDKDINYLSQHCYAHWIEDVPFSYPEKQPPSPEAAWQLMSQPVVSQIGSIEANVKLLKSLGLNNTRIQANEFKRGASRFWYSRTMMHALAQTDPLFRFISDPAVDGAVIHCLFNNGFLALDPAPWSKRALGWGIFIPDGQDFIASPVARLYVLAERLLADGDKVLKITGASAAVATYGNDKLKFILVNKKAEAVDADIHLDGFTVPAGTEVRTAVLASERLEDFPVDPITKERRAFPIRENRFRIDAPEFKCRLPKYSIMLFELDKVEMAPAEKIPFVAPGAEMVESDAKDFYETETKVPAPAPDTLLLIDFTREKPKTIQAKYPALSFDFHNLGDAAFSADGVYLDGNSYLRVGRLQFPREAFELSVLFKPEAGLDQAMAASVNHHFTGIGIWSGSLYSDVRTGTGRYRYCDSLAAYPAGKWLMMTLKYDGKNVTTILNGRQMDQAELTGDVVVTPLYIGSEASPDPKAKFRGWIKLVYLSSCKGK